MIWPSLPASCSKFHQILSPQNLKRADIHYRSISCLSTVSPLPFSPMVSCVHHSSQRMVYTRLFHSQAHLQHILSIPNSFLYPKRSSHTVKIELHNTHSCMYLNPHQTDNLSLSEEANVSNNSRSFFNLSNPVSYEHITLYFFHFRLQLSISNSRRCLFRLHHPPSHLSLIKINTASLCVPVVKPEILPLT